MRLTERKAQGFTLIEMAIVLVIIGIILAGVMKGRDIVRGAQVKQFSQQFAQKWGTIAQTYYDKTGNQLNDGTTNGGTAGVPNGDMDGGTGPAAVELVDILRNVGITPCTMVKSKLVAPVGTPVSGAVDAAHCGTGSTLNIFQTAVDGEYAGSATVSVDLTNAVITFGGTGNIFKRNVVVLYNVPTDVAIGLDTAIDGRVNGLDGACVNRGTGGAGLGYANNIAGGTQIATGGAFTTRAWGDAAVNAQQCTTVVLIQDY